MNIARYKQVTMTSLHSQSNFYKKITNQVIIIAANHSTTTEQLEPLQLVLQSSQPNNELKQVTNKHICLKKTSIYLNHNQYS